MKKKVFIVLILAIMFLPILNVSAVSKVSCGNIENIPEKIPQLTRLVVIFIQVLVPVILVVMGSIDLVKGVAAQKEDEIKKGQQMFIKRLIVGALIFFIIVIAKFFVSLVADSTDETNNITKCIDCFLSDSDSCHKQGRVPNPNPNRPGWENTIN